MFLVEEHANGDFTAFLPVSPTPTVGFVVKLPAAWVEPVDGSLGDAINSVIHWGLGTRDLVARARDTAPSAAD